MKAWLCRARQVCGSSVFPKPPILHRYLSNRGLPVCYLSTGHVRCCSHCTTPVPAAQTLLQQPRARYQGLALHTKRSLHMSQASRFSAAQRQTPRGKTEERGWKTKSWDGWCTTYHRMAAGQAAKHMQAAGLVRGAACPQQEGERSHHQNPVWSST